MTSLASSRRALIVFVASLAAASPSSAARLTSDAVKTSERKIWVHQLVHLRNAQDFDGGEFVHASLGTAFGVRLDPIRQPANVEDDGSACFTSAPIAPKLSFSELLASFNADVPAGAGLWFEVRVARTRDSDWSEWMRMSEWGGGFPEREATLEIDGGAIDVDYFRSPVEWARAQFRVIGWKGSAKDAAIKLSRVDLTFSSRDAFAPPNPDAPRPIPDAAWRTRLDVPFRSQRDAGAELASRVCSPTSVAMVMEFYGVKRSEADVAARLFDAKHDLYGNWTRAVEGAYSFGVDGYLARFAEWDPVERSIAIGQPLVISIAAKPGELRGAPYESTAGHLLVLCGFDASGDVCVNDPAAANAADGRRSYSRADLETCWLKRGGTAYVLLSKR